MASSAVRQGAIEVACPVCGRVQTVFLGGFRPQRAARRAGVGDPRTPPIEDGPVRPWRR